MGPTLNAVVAVQLAQLKRYVNSRVLLNNYKFCEFWPQVTGMPETGVFLKVGCNLISRAV